MGFTEAVKSGFSKCFDYRTRASRSEYWYFQLLSILVILGSIVVDVGILEVPFDADRFGESHSIGKSPFSSDQDMGFDGPLYVASFIVFVPIISLSVRRLHDLNVTGWLTLGHLVPFAPLIFILVFCFKGTEGENSYGSDPLKT